jgi:hypothetical protein
MELERMEVWSKVFLGGAPPLIGFIDLSASEILRAPGQQYLLADC